MQINRNELRLKDTLKVTVLLKNMNTLVIDFGDSTSSEFTLSGVSQEIYDFHVYQDTGTYILGAFGFNAKSAYSKRELIVVTP